MRGGSPPQVPRGNPRGRPRKRGRGGRGSLMGGPTDHTLFIHPATAHANITQHVYYPPPTSSSYNTSVTPTHLPNGMYQQQVPSGNNYFEQEANRINQSQTPQNGVTNPSKGLENMTPSLLFQIQNSRSGSSSDDSHLSKASSPSAFYGKNKPSAISPALPQAIPAPTTGIISSTSNMLNGNIINSMDQSAQKSLQAASKIVSKKSHIAVPTYVAKASPMNGEVSGQSKVAARQPSGPLAVTLRKRKAEAQPIIDHTTTDSESDESSSEAEAVTTSDPDKVAQATSVLQAPKATRGRGRGGRPRGRGRGRIANAGRVTAPTSATTSRDVTPAISGRAIAAALGARGGGRGRGKRQKVSHFDDELETLARQPDFEWYTNPEGRCTIQKPARESIKWPNYKRERDLLACRARILEKTTTTKELVELAKERRDELRGFWKEGAAALVEFNDEIARKSYEEVFRSRRIFHETEVGKKATEELQILETKPFSREDDIFKISQYHQSENFLAEKSTLEQSTRMLLVEAAERAIRNYIHEGHEDIEELKSVKIPLITHLICYVTGIPDIRAVTMPDLRAAFLNQQGYDKTEWDQPQPAIRSNEGLYERTILKTKSAWERENGIPKLKETYGEVRIQGYRIQVLDSGSEWRRNGSLRILPPEPRELEQDMRSKTKDTDMKDQGLRYIILSDDEEENDLKEENDDEMQETYQYGGRKGFVQDWRTDPKNPAQFNQPINRTTSECETISALMALGLDTGAIRPAFPRIDSKVQYPYPVNSLCFDVETRNERVRNFAYHLPEILLENLKNSYASAINDCNSALDRTSPELVTAIEPTPEPLEDEPLNPKPHPLRQSERASSVESLDTIEGSDDEWETLVRESSSVSEYEDEEMAEAGRQVKSMRKEGENKVDTVMEETEREEQVAVGQEILVELVEKEKEKEVETGSEEDAAMEEAGKEEQVVIEQEIPEPVEPVEPVEPAVVKVEEHALESQEVAQEEEDEEEGEKEEEEKEEENMANTSQNEESAVIEINETEKGEGKVHESPSAVATSAIEELSNEPAIIETPAEPVPPVSTPAPTPLPEEHLAEAENPALVANTPVLASLDISAVDKQSIEQREIIEITSSVASSPASHHYEVEPAVSVFTPQTSSPQLTAFSSTPVPPITSDPTSDTNASPLDIAVRVAEQLRSESATLEIEDDDGDFDMVEFETASKDITMEPVRKKRGRPRDSKPNYSFRVNKQKPYRGDGALTSKPAKSKGRTPTLPTPASLAPPIVSPTGAYAPQHPNFHPAPPPFGFEDDPNSGWPRRFSGQNHTPSYHVPMPPTYSAPVQYGYYQPVGYPSPGHHPQLQPQHPTPPSHPPSPPLPPQTAPKNYTVEFFAEAQTPNTNVQPIISTFQSRRTKPLASEYSRGGPNLGPYDPIHSPPMVSMTTLTQYRMETPLARPVEQSFDPRLLEPESIPQPPLPTSLRSTLESSHTPPPPPPPPPPPAAPVLANTPTPPPPAPVVPVAAGVKYYIGGGKFKIGPPPGVGPPQTPSVGTADSPTLSNASGSIRDAESDREHESMTQLLEGPM